MSDPVDELEERLDERIEAAKRRRGIPWEVDDGC